jgi:hypothetical protein
MRCELCLRNFEGVLFFEESKSSQYLGFDLIFEDYKMYISSKRR